MKLNETLKGELKAIIFTGVGEASMCWENVDKAGIFNDTLAKDVGDRLEKSIITFFEKLEIKQKRCER